jgi:hypothetical protein
VIPFIHGQFSLNLPVARALLKCGRSMLQFAVLRSAPLDVRAMWRELIDLREVPARQMSRRDLLLCRKQMVIGFGWAVFSRVVGTVLFSVLLSRAAQPLDALVRAYPSSNEFALLAAAVGEETES